MHTSPTDPPPTGTATDPTRATAEEEELEDQKAAITRLGHELRALVEATVRTAASPDTLHRVADGVRAITSRLTGRQRSRAEIPEVDEFPTGTRIYSPVTGAGSPLAPPVQVTPTADGLVGSLHARHRPRRAARLRPRRHERHAPGRTHGPRLRSSRNARPDRLPSDALPPPGPTGNTSADPRPRHRHGRPQDLRERVDHHPDRPCRAARPGRRRYAPWPQTSGPRRRADRSATRP